jgi:hypothetical protein
MFEQLATLHQFQVGFIKMLTADMSDEDLGVSPFPGANPAVWVLGHLAICTDYAGRLLGLRPECPREWHTAFAPGSNPAEVPQPYPSMETLVTAISSGAKRCLEALPNADAQALSQPHGIELLKSTNLKTNADLLSHLMTTHMAFHAAQLSACRRKKGRPPII